jgi:mRNA-degrading endonuclease RelE of RelBE toxin-antitoxin system
VKIEWTLEAQQSMRRYMHDQQGMHAISRAVQDLVDDPTPVQAFPWGKAGDYRLRVGPYRLMYRLGADQITIGHVSRVTD